jgi:hypothetical protein
MVCSTFGMTDNDVPAACVFDHFRTNITGMRPGLAGMAILAANGYPCALHHLFQRKKELCRRANRNFTPRFG